MTFDLMGVLRDAWAMAKRDRDVLIGVAGIFLLIPQLAIAMFVPQPPAFPGMSDQAAVDAWLAKIEIWSQSYSLGVLALAVVMQFGVLALLRLYLDAARPDALRAISGAIGDSPSFIVLAVLTSVPVTSGVLLFVLPGIYIQGRLLLAAPAFVAGRPIGPIAAFRRSLALTRGKTLPMLALGSITLLAGDLLAAAPRMIGAALNGAPMANPVVAAVLDLGAAAGVTAGMVAAVLIQVAAYRRARSPSIGI